MLKTDIAEKLSLGNHVAIISGDYDQCCATLGCGFAGSSHSVMYGIGAFICVFPEFLDVNTMYSNKMHIEHHVVLGSYNSFIYNQMGGTLIKWFRKHFWVL